METKIFQCSHTRKKVSLSILLTFLIFESEIAKALDIFHYSSISGEFKAQCQDNGGEVMLYDTCYVSSQTETDFESAERECKGKGMSILSVTTKEERAHLRTKKMLSKDKIWLNIMEVVAGRYLKWADGFSSNLYSNQLQANWTQTENSLCPITTNQGLDISFVECTKAASYVCKRQFYSTCYPSWRFDAKKNSCYRLFGTKFDSEKDPNLSKLNVQDSISMCQSYLFGHLMTTFAGSFATSWDPYWKSTGDNWKAWVGFFYKEDSKTGFVDDSNNDLSLDEELFFKSRNEPKLYECSYYHKTDEQSKNKVRIYPDNQCLNTRLFMCEAPSKIETNRRLEAAIQTVSSNKSLKSATCGSFGRHPSIKRYSIVKGKIISRNNLAKLHSRSLIECALYCSDYPGCTSFNYRDIELRNNCELDDAVEESEDLERLTSDSDHIYRKCI